LDLRWHRAICGRKKEKENVKDNFTTLVPKTSVYNIIKVGTILIRRIRQLIAMAFNAT